MLLWLDTNSNRVGKPNENFARELLEFFTFGIGNYTEVDIKEAARCFTGWQVRSDVFWFNRRAHDDGSKEVLGKTNVRTGEEVIQICVREEASAELIAKKLFAYFVHPRPSPALVALLAQTYVDSGREVGRYLKTLFSSRLFYSDDVRRMIVASPVDYVIGTLRTMGATAAPKKLARTIGDMG